MTTTTGNPLEAYFRANQGRLIHKWLHYFDIYDRHFAPFRGKPVTIVEFGVSHGGSLQMWKDYFGPGAKITGVDIDPRCEKLTEDQVEVVIGDQEDRGFLRELAARVGDIDVLIEDGGHTMRQQINTFEEFWPNIVDGGVFLIEDLHTSYWRKYGGGYQRAGTFIEYAKDLVDQLHAWHSQDKPGLGRGRLLAHDPRHARVRQRDRLRQGPGRAADTRDHRQTFLVSSRVHLSAGRPLRRGIDRSPRPCRS